LVERWRRPAIPISLEQTDQVVTLPDGRSFAVNAPALKPEDIERARAGYLCLKCLEPFERPWPERCHVCGAPIRTEQAAYLAREYGEIQLGSSTSLEDELAALREKEEHNGS
jgi:hypothetical protein